MEHIDRQVKQIIREARKNWGDAWCQLGARQKAGECAMIFQRRVIGQISTHDDVFDELQQVGRALWNVTYTEHNEILQTN